MMMSALPRSLSLSSSAPQPQRMGSAELPRRRRAFALVGVAAFSVGAMLSAGVVYLSSGFGSGRSAAAAATA